ncbi:MULTISPECIES: anti-sigma factor family protein [Actinoplanes]|uniref:Uncharacterized protein n=2 Tax=Actinoplanes TaxID=1865 RepID=A0A0X3UPW2_9ACTN|nr:MULTISPECIES: zf-HC2 domain-containing protein [Actinoplanes]KUL34554.1 hypothetical protein ADL15_15900 [Actinoplanes awajinensis subsp. mycoplanecinus]GIE72296.1 membrane protein [Actinoplanes palleronii]
MTGHPNPTWITRYADGDPALDEATVWSVEVHLEDCADCRALLTTDVPDDLRALLERVAAGVDEGVTTGPAPARRRPWSAARHRWLIWQLVPWLTMTIAVLGCAVLLQGLQPSLPSLVLLLAPVAPLPGVAVAWSRGSDPAWELIAGTPTAGLPLLLRRTAAVLAVVIPVLGLASDRTGASLALALLPCLAFTTVTVALGVFVGVRRAALGLAAGWGLAVAVPSLINLRLPGVLQAGSAGLWLLVIAVSAGFALIRSDRFRRLSSHH